MEMSSSGYLINLPNLHWNVPDLCAVTTACSETFYLEGLVERTKSKLKLRLKSADGSSKLRYELYLISKGGSFVFKNPTSVSVCVQDKFQSFKSEFKQLRSIQGTVNSPVLIWSVERNVLLAKCNFVEKSNDFIIFCKFEQISDVAVENKGATDCPEKPPAAKMASSLPYDLLKYFVHSQEPDVVLKCNSKMFFAHRSLLSARSRVFAGMFECDAAKNSIGSVDIIDMEPTHLKQFLEYICSDTVSNLSKDSVQHLYVAGVRYAVEGLKTLCVNFMMDSIDVENALQFLAIAGGHNDEDFKKRIIDFIVKHNVLLKNKNWGKFVAHHPDLTRDVYYSAHACVAL